MKDSIHATYSIRIGFGLAILSVALIMTEIVLTRLFSVIVWNHFAFFAISIALFGTGAASIWIYVRQRTLAPEKTEALLSKYCVALSAVILVSDILILNIPPDWFGDFGINPFTQITARLVCLFVIAAAPFFAGGMALSLAMMRYATQIHRLYFWDLLGAGMGCLLVIPCLSLLGGPLSLLVSAGLAALAGLTFSLSGAGTFSRSVYKASALSMICVIPLLGLYNSFHHLFDVKVAKGINLNKEAPEYNGWNSFSLVTVFSDKYKHFGGWGISPIFFGSIVKQKTLVIDMNAFTPIVAFDGSLNKVRQVFFDLSALVYRIRPNPEKVCVIGAGGGRDVLAALVGGAKHVTGVEVNPLIAEIVMKGKYRKYSGELYSRGDVTIHVEDGRSFIRSTKDKYDVILLSMVDTSAATAAGAYALTENGLYTTDAFRDYLSRLKPGGILSVSQVSIQGLYSGARLAALARDALSSMGSNPATSVMVAQAQRYQVHAGTLHDVLIKPDGFTQKEIETFARHVRILRFIKGYLPGINYSRQNLEQIWIKKILTRANDAVLAEEMDRWPLDVSPVSDDRPFFAYQNRFHDLIQAFTTPTGYRHLFGNGLIILTKIALTAICMVVLFLMLPVFLARRELRQGEGSVAFDLAYVACLGIGFMFLEIALIQRLMLYLGNPTYALTVVLFVLLLSGGMGSRSFLLAVQRGSSRRLLYAVFVLVVVYALALGTNIGAIFATTLSWPTIYRALFAGCLVAPLGFLLGIPLPTGLRSIAQRAGNRIPWLWSINSATSVMGSIFATMTSLHAGITISLYVGATFYGFAMLLWFRISFGSEHK